MDECFRFLINVDQCLNMSTYDIFFYKLKNERKYRLNQLQNHTETAFAEAFRDIQMYLNKYPYHFKEYQIIITMGSPREAPGWGGSLLRQLLQLNLEMHHAQICMDSGPSVDSALNLFLFRESDPHQEQKDPENYLSSVRLENDCRLLLQHMTACINASSEKTGLDAIVAEYRKRKPEDQAVAVVLERFIESRAISASADPVKALSDFFRELFTNFNVIELLQSHDLHHASRMNTREMLRIVEYITAPVEYVPQSLSTRCFELWNAVKDQDLESKYSDMLFAYEQMLKYAHEQLELEPLPVDRKTTKLPEDFYKRPGSIGMTDIAFQKTEEKQAQMLVALDQFLQTKHRASTIRKSWEDAYAAMEQNLQQLESNLKNNAIDMGHRYSRRVENRKKEALHWKGKRFFADGKTEEKIASLEKKREAYMKVLRNPDLTPSLKFEDQARTKTVLDQANAEILYYLDCLKTSSKANFLRLFSGAFLATLLHYIWLQPFSFHNVVSGPVVFVALLVIAGGMGLSYFLPGLYYRRAIRSCALRLKKELDEYIPEYHGRTEKFLEYLNTLDQLDRTSKLITIYRDQLEHTRRLERGCMWHKTRIQDHLIKLGAFRSLIDSGSGRSRSCTFDPENCPTAELLTVRKLNDIEQCCLYWPQGR